MDLLEEVLKKMRKGLDNTTVDDLKNEGEIGDIIVEIGDILLDILDTNPDLSKKDDCKEEED